MILTYRGTSYQTSNLTVNTPQTRTKVTYRGQSYQINASLKVSKPNQNLTYRGVKYSQQITPNLEFAFN
jgi:hypothetical protein